MRRWILIGFAAVFVVLLSAGAWYRLSFHGDALQAARSRMANGDMRGAEFYLRRALREHPGSAEASFRLGEVDLALGNAGGAELELRRARSRGYDFDDIVEPLAQAMLQQRHVDDILHEFDPDQPQADGTAAPLDAKGRARMLSARALALLATHDFAAAKAASDRAEAGLPGDQGITLTATRVALARDDVPGAASRIETILGTDPRQPDALLLRIEIALRHNDPNAALADADTALKAAPKRLDVRLAKARVLAALNRDKEAATLLATLLQAAPRDPGANYLQAILAMRRADYPAADAALGVLSPIVSQLPRGLYMLAVAKLGVGQPAQAEEAAQKFRAANPDDPDGTRLVAYIDIVRQRPAEALALLQPRVDAARASGTVDTDTLDLYARAQALTGDLAGASRTLARASHAAPTDTALLNRLASIRLQMGDTGAARTDLQRSLALQPAQPQVTAAAVQAALSQGDFDAAKARIDQLRSAVGNTDDVAVLEAQFAIARLDLDSAEATLKDVLKHNPDSRPATLGLVRVDGLRMDRKAGEALLMDWLHRHPTDQEALGLALPALFAEGRANEAVALAEAAHEAAAANPALTAALAGAYVQAKTPDRAVALLDRSGAEVNPDLEMLRAHVLVVAGKGERALQAYETLLERNPALVAARITLAELQAQSGDVAAARVTLREGMRLNPGDAAAMRALVEIDLKDGGIDKALATASSLAQDPHNQPAAASLAGDAQMAVRDYAKAAQAYQAAFDAAPSAELVRAAAAAYAQAGDNTAADGLLTRWTAQHSDDMAAQMQLAALYLIMHRQDDAAIRLRAVLASRPSEPSVLNNLAWIAMQKGDMAQAASLARRAYVASPTAPVADTFGWILAKQNETAQALPLLARAASSAGPDQGARQYHYAYVLNASGKPAEAKVLLQRALTDPAPFDEKPDAQRLLDTLDK